MAINTVLVIEDDRFIGEMYIRSLRKAGYNVDWMVDGNDGLVAARNKSYDLILLDIMLPEKKGSDILDELRGRGTDQIPNTKVVVMTNFDQDDESRARMQKYTQGYLVKAEITPRKLLDIISSLDESNGEQAPDTSVPAN